MDAVIKKQDDKLYVSGQVDFATVPIIWKNSLSLLSNDKGAKLEIDCSGITSSTSAAIALILEWIQYSKAHQQSIQFTGMPQQIISIMEAANIKKVLDTYF
ncbi:MAG: STAS domain-containing protein [Gammaproteobacteria bacterium]|nr:STAS domain-containing protein [Gammaproteobacteria bacterium]